MYMYNRQEKQLSWVSFLAIEMQGTHTTTLSTIRTAAKLTEICTTALPTLFLMESTVFVGF